MKKKLQLFQKGERMHKNARYKYLQIGVLSGFSLLFDSMSPFESLISMMIVLEKYLII